MTKTRFRTLVTAISLIAMSIFAAIISYASRPGSAIAWFQQKYTLAIRAPNAPGGGNFLPQAYPNLGSAGPGFPLLEFRWLSVTISNLAATIRSTALNLFWYGNSLTRQLTFTIAREVQNAMIGLASMFPATQPLVPIPVSMSISITDDTTDGPAARHDGNERSSPDSVMLSGTRPQPSSTYLLAPSAA